MIGKKLTCTEGKHTVEVFVGNSEGLPSIYVIGEVIKSDPTWEVSNFLQTKQVGYSDRYTKLFQNPNKLYYATNTVLPAEIKEIDGGTLYDFGRAINGKLELDWLATDIEQVTLCYGESATEARDVEMCYYKQEGVTKDSLIRKRAFRYIFIPGVKEGSIGLIAKHEFYPRSHRAKWKSDQKRIDQIWRVAQTTFDLCSDWFFIDGIKRDRWIWAGDAYQANFINQYLNFDEETDKRTILALRGHDEVKQNLNTIVDYSILWVISVYNHYMMTGDREFLAQVFSKMKSMMDYLMDQTDENGFIYERPGDWIFVDWSEIDKEGPTAAEQLFLVAGYQALVACGKVLGLKVSNYQKEAERLLENTLKYFWDEGKGCFIDSYQSGKSHVSRHPNILAVIFDLVSEERQQQILNNVLLNDEITQITTPYFKFFEQDALCKLGKVDQVLDTINTYWGGMLDQGATTFWEEYDAAKKGAQHYEMYGDRYGKSLCHAWGASPLYLLGKYYVGLRPLEPGYQSFEICPRLDSFKEVECTLPVKGGQITITKNDGMIRVVSTRPGGKIVVGKDSKELPANEVVEMTI